MAAQDWGQVSCLQSPCSCHEFTFYLYANAHGLHDTKYLRNTSSVVIQVKACWGLFVLYSECAIIMKFISPATSKSFPSFRVLNRWRPQNIERFALKQSSKPGRETLMPQTFHSLADDLLQNCWASTQDDASSGKSDTSF